MGNLKFEGCPKLSEIKHDDNLFLSSREERQLSEEERNCEIDFRRKYSWHEKKKKEKSCEIDIRRKYSWHEAGNLKTVQRDEKESHTKLKDKLYSI